MDSSSKRSLYRPAPVENVGAKENRRALAQGHLVNESLLPEGLTVYAAPSMDLSGTDTVTTISHSGSHPTDHSSLTPPRQALASLSLSNQTASMMTSDLSSSGPRGSPMTHHRYQSERSYMPPRSPSKPSPSHFLELSDSDREYIDHQRNPIRHHSAPSGSPVLLVDASRSLRVDQGILEMDVRTASIASPAKVVCHALSIVETDLRNSGYTEEAARVHIDSVPTVTMPSDVGLVARASAERSQPPRSSESPLVSRESSVTSDKLAIGGDATTSTLKPSDAMSQQSDSQQALQDVNLSTESERPSSAMSIDESRGTSTKKKKKVKAKFVQSRYMQSLSKTSAPAPAPAPAASSSKTVSNKSVSNTSTTTRTRTRPGSATVTRPERTKSSSHRAAGPMRATAPFSAKLVSASRNQSTSAASATAGAHQPAKAVPTGRSQFSYTPVNNKKGSKRFASTPAAPSSDHLINASTIAASTSMFGSDMSAIAPADSSRLVTDRRKDVREHSSDRSKKERVMSSVTGDYSMMSSSAGQDSAYSSLGHKQARQLTSQDLDVLYARYIQAVFLDTKMRKVVADKEKEAMSQLYALWKENDELARKKANCELKLARLKHASMLDMQLEIQETGLDPVAAHLSQYRQQYSTLAHALDTTRHQVELTDVVMPEDTDQFHYSLERALNQSEHLLGEIAMATRSKQPKLVAFSSAISMLEQAVANESTELKRCQELLAATSSLSTHETSLRVQQIDLRAVEA